LTVPTISGFPIRIAINGSAIVDLGFKGNVDLRKAISRPRTFKLDGELKASAAVEITGSLTLDATVTKIGLRMRNTASAGASLKGRVGVDKGRKFKFEIDTPTDSVQVFEARSRFSTIFGSREKRRPSVAKDERTKAEFCTGRNVDEIFGLELCAEAQSPISSMRSNYAEFLLNGPARISATLYKTDSHKKYHISAGLTQSKKNKLFQVHIDTPGSKVNRKLGLDATVNIPKQEVNAIAVLPWRRTSVNVTLVGRHGLYLASGRILTSEARDLYAYAAELRTVAERTKTKMQMKASFLIPKRRDPGLDLEGAITVHGTFPHLKYITVDLALAGLAKTKTSLKGKLASYSQEKIVKLDFVHKNRRYSFHLINKLTTYPRRGTTIDSYVDIETPQGRVLRLINALNWKKQDSLKLQTHLELVELMKKLQLHVSLSRSSKRRRLGYDADIWIKCPPLSAKFKGQVRVPSQKLITSQFSLAYLIPKVAKNQIHLKSKFQRKNRKSQKTKGVFTKDELDLHIRYGNYHKDKRNQIFLGAEITKQLRGVHKATLSYMLKALIPALNMTSILSGKHHHTKKTLESSFVFHDKSLEKMAATVKIENLSKRLKKYKGDLDFFWDGKEYSLKTFLDQKTIWILIYRITLIRQGVMTHDILTQVQTSKFKAQTLKSQIYAEGYGRSTFETSIIAQSRKFQFSGKMASFRNGVHNTTYGFHVETIRPRNLQSIKVGSEVFYPGRRLTMKMTGSNKPEKKGGHLEINLNAARTACGSRCLITVKSLMIKKKSGETERVWTKFDVSTPLNKFSKFSNVGLHTLQATNSSHNYFDGHIYWGEQRKKGVSGSLKVKKPLRWDSINADLIVKTQSTAYQVIEANISHTLSPEMVSLLNAFLGLDGANVSSVKEEGKAIWQNGDARDIKFFTEFDSNLKAFSKRLSLNVDHYYDEARVKSMGRVTHDKDVYSCDVNANVVAPHGLRDVQSFGDILIKSPSNTISATWDHKNSLEASKSLLKSNWNSDHVIVLLHGKQQGWGSPVDPGNKSLSSTLTFERTSDFLKNVTVLLDHEQGQTWFKNRIEVIEGAQNVESTDGNKDNQDSLALSELNASWYNASAEVNYEMKTSKWKNLVLCKGGANFTSLPYNIEASVAWTPNQTISALGSITSLQWDDFELQMDIQTPFQEFANATVTLQSQWLKEEGNFSIKSTAEVYNDEGDSKNISMDARLVSTDDACNVDICLLSPFEGFRNVTLTGFYRGQDLEFFETYANIMFDQSSRFVTELNIDGVTSNNFRLSADVAKSMTPGRWVSNSNVTIEHKSNSKGSEYETNTNFKVSPGTVALHNKFSIASPNKMAYSLYLKTPLKDYQHVGTDMGYEYGIQNFTAHAKVASRHLQMEGKIERKDSESGKAFRSLLNLTSPYTDTVSHDLVLMHDKEGFEMKCALDTFFEDFRGFLVHGAYFKKPRSYCKHDMGTKLTIHEAKQDRIVLPSQPDRQESFVLGQFGV
ncbi:hypothetical protein EGW08_007328, partial [Elysia chlorotica]